MPCSSVETVNQATYGGGGILKGQKISEDKQKAGREWREIFLSPKGQEARSLETQRHRRHISVHYEHRYRASGTIGPCG